MKVRSASPYAVQVEGFTVEEHMHNVLSDKEQIICKVEVHFTDWPERAVFLLPIQHFTWNKSGF